MGNNLKVRWTDEAQDKFDEILFKIIQNWNLQSAKKFDDSVKQLINRLESNPRICPSSKRRNIRKCVIHPNTSVIYRIKKDHIQLLTFVYNRSNHPY